MISYEDFRKNLKYPLVGVAPLSAFADLPDNENPLCLFPDARSVLVLGKRLHRGSFRGMEEGSLWGRATRWLTEFDSVVRYIEKQGYECVPYTPLDADRMPQRAVRPGLCPPNKYRISIEYAAVAAGLGEIGYHGMFMSREYGIRQALGMLVTDMPITPGPGKNTADGNICEQCLECARACPLQAISLTQSRQLNWGDHSMRVGLINPLACQACPNGACGDSKYFAGAEELHYQVKNNQVLGDNSNQQLGGTLPNRLCAACGRACIAHFEAKNPGNYHHAFRIREPWGFRPDEIKE
ncbi:MAG: hypothetical protein WCT05_03055 [Lentisphaeria bacterium]